MDLDRWFSTDCAISTVHDDVIQAQILTRLDGPSLACAACASSRLRFLVASDNTSLWTEASHAAWPSTSSSLLAELIPSFPNGYLSFFSDSHPVLLPVTAAESTVHPEDPPSGLISAVDLFYYDRILLSQVVETETRTAWFGSSPFSIDALGPKESIPTDVNSGRTETFHDLACRMRLSWILIDRRASGRERVERRACGGAEALADWERSYGGGGGIGTVCSGGDVSGGRGGEGEGEPAGGEDVDGARVIRGERGRGKLEEQGVEGRTAGCRLCDGWGPVLRRFLGSHLFQMNI